MNTSALDERIKAYLGSRGAGASVPTEEIARAKQILHPMCRFRYEFARFTSPPGFLSSPPYARFFAGCGEFILAVMTLGAETDALIERLMKSDMALAVTVDAAASATLEQLSDEYEERFGERRTRRFCPGYGGTDAADARFILGAVDARRAGVTITESGYMRPSKSMAGIIGIKTGKGEDHA